MRVPPGVSPGDFSEAIAQFQEAIGKQWVFTSDEDVDLYRDSYSPFWHEQEEPIPSAAVAPDGVEQVQAVVRIANRDKIPLSTISTGKKLAGGGRTPMRDQFDPHCGMEVVLPNGEVMRTGMGALPNSKTWQQYRYGFGPYVNGMFSQSSLGVVTKMGFWLFPEPEAYLTGTVSVPKRDDLVPLVAGLAYPMNSSIVLGTTSV